MTFRPSDDVIDSMEQGNPSTEVSNNLNTISNTDIPNDSSQQNGTKIFSNPNEEIDGNVVENNNMVQNVQSEEVKAPDLSEILGKNGGDVSSSNVESENKTGDKVEDGDYTVDLSEMGKDKESDSLQSNNVGNVETESSAAEGGKKDIEDDISLGKMSDEERSEIVAGIEGSIHSKLDFLVDDEWKRVVETYKKIYRIVFRWGVFIFVVILGILSGVFIQVKANQPDTFHLVGESSIQNKDKWTKSNIDKILSNPIADNVGIEPIISYGSISFTDKSFQSKSNLVKYKGIVLPQLAFVDFYSDGFISLEDFNDKKTSRKDLENMVKVLITDKLIGDKTSKLSSAQDLRWNPQVFDGGLIEGFGLSCVNSAKLSDFVCDRILERFYEYGKYYDLSRYSSDILILVRKLSEQGKDIQPICTMVVDYVWHSGVTSSDILGSVMNYCTEEDRRYYRKVVNFIDIENSLRQPELLDKVFDDPDLNAYKLISAQQTVSKLVNNSSINENFIKTYLNFVQNLLNKDRGSGKYLEPIYKDILYVFNTDVLYDTLQNEGKLSSEIKTQIDHINKGDKFLEYEPLISQLTTPDAVKVSSGWNPFDVDEKTIEEVFAKYKKMNERLKIRRSTVLSDTDMQVQTEIYSDAVFRVTGGESLKATVLLYRKQNVLYVKSINVSNQHNLSDTLNIYAADGNVTFDAMLGYIDEQIGFWYKAPGEDEEPEFTLCDSLDGRGDIELYSCDDSSIVLYKGDVEYTFTLWNGILDSFTISDSDIDSALRGMFSSIMTSKENTPTAIESIINFTLEASEEGDIEKKLEIIDQFRIHFKLIPTVSDIEGEDDVFMVEFSIGDDFELKARYNVKTHLLTRISYVACDKTLEIRNLTIEVSSNNEDQLIEILNNPRIFFANANPAAYRKYQRMCE